MRYFGRLFWLYALGLSLVGCSASVPKDAFPDMIGKYKLEREYVIAKPFTEMAEFLKSLPAK